MEELTQGAVPGVDTAHQLAFVEAEGECVIRLPRPRFPRGLVTGHHRREPVEVPDHAAVDRLVEGEQPGLMAEELAYGNRLLALLRKLWPVGGDPFFVVQPAARVGD